MTQLLVNFTRKIVYLSWLKNSVYIYPDIIISVNITEKYIVKVVLSYAVGSVTVYTIWCLFVFRFPSWYWFPVSYPKCELPKLIIRHNIGPILATNSRLLLFGQCRRLHRSSGGPTTAAFVDCLNLPTFSQYWASALKQYWTNTISRYWHSTG